MKTMKNITMVMVACLINVTIFAQEEPASVEKLVIHIDQVKPSMTSEYKTIAKELRDLLSQNAIADFSYSALTNDRNEFIMVSPVESMAELDKNPFGSLVAKIGEDKFQSLMDKMDATYNSHKTFIMNYHVDKSYLPDIPEDELYREWFFMNVDPADSKKLMAINNEWNALYVKHDLKFGYRFFSGGFGSDESTFVVMSWGKDASDFNAKMMERNELFGDEGSALWQKTLDIINNMDRTTGYSLPELSYIPPAGLVSED